MEGSMKRSFVALFLCAAMIPAAADAQRALEVEPLVGAYTPHGSYEHTAAYFRVGTPESPRDNAGTAYGANARLWLTREFGVQLQGITSRADHPTAFTPGGGAFATSTRITSLTAQALFRPQLPTRAQLWLSAGGGTIKHAGTAYTPYGSPSRTTLALGAGGTVPIWRSVSVAGGVDGLFYDWALSDSYGMYQSGTQTDVVAHLGLSLTVR
jgi:hypothetical protein